MTTKNTGGPAFPFQAPNGGPTPATGGMSLRDWFAGNVCAAMMTTTSADTDYPNLDYLQNSGGQTAAERIAGISYQMADAMLKAREET